jgi:hypothetical protein
MRPTPDKKTSWRTATPLAVFVLLTGCSSIIPEAEAAAPASLTVGKTTRYWDCCKPSAAWSGKAAVSKPVQACAKDGKTAVGADTKSGCDGGSAYMCANQQPWAVSATLAYGFAAVSIAGQSESDWSCACYKLDFTTAPLVGKSMIVQATNTGSDLGGGHFDLTIPGGGVGIFNGCSSQYGAPSDGWGARYGGVSSQSQCSQLPADLQPGCNWRFTWLQNADNPGMNFHRVKCPTAITAKTGCVRNDDGSQPTN